MPVIISTRTLRKEPGGETTGSSAPVGAKVEILEGRDTPWLKVKVLGGPDEPEGWISFLAVDPTKDTLGKIDKAAFADTCAWDSLLIETSAHYMLAVAELRTDVSDGASSQDGDWGPFALGEKEWASYAARPEYQLSYTADDRKNWLAQCMVFAAMANAAQQRIAAKLTDQPNAVELYLTQIFGSALAHAVLTRPDEPLETLIAAASAAELDVEGITLGRVRDRRYQGAATGKEAIALLTADLQRAIDDTRQFAASAHAQLLDAGNARIAPEGTPNMNINFNASIIRPERKQFAVLIANRFADAGYGPLQQITAIANAIAESNLKPNAVGDNEHSHGLFQLNQNGGVGAGFSTAELEDPERNIAIMLDHIARNEKTADATFRAATSLLQAVTVFVRNFERPANQPAEIAKRVEIARELVV